MTSRQMQQEPASSMSEGRMSLEMTQLEDDSPSSHTRRCVSPVAQKPELRESPLVRPAATASSIQQDAVEDGNTMEAGAKISSHECDIDEDEEYAIVLHEENSTTELSEHSFQNNEMKMSENGEQFQEVTPPGTPTWKLDVTYASIAATASAIKSEIADTESMRESEHKSNEHRVYADMKAHQPAQYTTTSILSSWIRRPYALQTSEDSIRRSGYLDIPTLRIKYQDLKAEKRQLSNENEKMLRFIGHQKAERDEIYHRFQADYAVLEKQNEELQKELAKQYIELSDLQRRDYATNKGQSVLLDDSAKASIDEVFTTALTTWTRTHFRVPFGKVKTLLISDDNHCGEFKKVLKQLFFDPERALGHPSITTPILVHAIVSAYLSEFLIDDPFKPYTKAGHEAAKSIKKLYMITRENDPATASKFRSASISALEIASKKYDLDETGAPWPARDAFYHKLSKAIHDTLAPIASLGRDVTYEKSLERYQKLHNIVQLCGEIGLDWAQRHFEVRCLDKKWIEEKKGDLAWRYDGKDPGLEGVYGDDDEDRDIWRCEGVLCPGFIKIGNDQGEEFDKKILWKPAKVLISSELSGEEDGSTSTMIGD